MLAVATLFRLYRKLPREGSFADAALKALDITSDADGMQRIPPAGPLVVVANHPFGLADGLVLISLLQRIRPDIKVLANRLLGYIPELRENLLLVDAFGRQSELQRNALAIRAAIRWIRNGGALGVFPSGEVAHSAGSDGQIVDSAWSPAIARMIRQSGADVVPMFFGGSNSSAFCRIGRIHPRLRTALLPRELLKVRGRRIEVRVGTPVPVSRLERFPDPAGAASYLRIRTYALAEDRGTRTFSTPDTSTIPARIAGPEPVDALEREVEALGASAVLVSGGGMDVRIARAGENPHTLREIGRLREVTFRRAGEGSGRERDLDSFDQDYYHLFVWNRQRCEIVSAYRMGPTDEILPRRGIEGLYTSTLFRYDSRLLDQIAPALELGRAFVREEYQKDYSPLLLLWRGIAAFVAKHPRYRRLFGPVSISSDYASLSRRLLARFIYTTSYQSDLGQLVTPKNPPSFLRARDGVQPVFGSVARSLAELGALLAEIESDGKGVPVLLRQYLRLNARLLGFNLDPAFGNVLDGLMLVDLLDVDRAVLGRYMGSAAMTSFLRHHGTGGPARSVPRSA